MPNVSLEKFSATSGDLDKGTQFAIPVWEQRIGEHKVDFDRFMVFCKEADPTESITEFVMRAYPDQPEVLDVALANDWWPRRTAYIVALKEIVIANAQVLAFTGVSRAVKTGLEALEIVRRQIEDYHKKNTPIDAPEYIATMKRFESLTNLMTRAAKATTSIDIKLVNNNIAPSAGGKVAMFSSEWDG